MEDHGAPSGGRSHHSDGNENDNGDGVEDTYSGEKGSTKGKGSMDGKGKGKGKAREDGKGKGNGNCKGKGTVKQTPGGGDISHSVALRLQKEMYEADSDTQGSLQWVYSELEALPTVLISSDDDTDSTEESDSEYDSEFDSELDMRMEDDVDAPDGVVLEGDVDMERDGDDEEEEDEEEKEEDVDDGKQPRMIGQGEMVNTSADDVDTMGDYHPIVLPEHGQEMCKHTPQPQPPVPTPRPQTLEPHPQPQTPDTHPLDGLEYLGLTTPQKPRPAVPTLQEAEAAGNTSDVGVDKQLLMASVSGDSLPNVPLPNVPLPDVPPADGPLPEVYPDGSVGEEWTSPRVGEQAMCVWFDFGSGSCLVPFL